MKTTDRWKRIEELFEQALDLPTFQRASFLDQQCANDRPMRDQLESLLAEDSRARADFLERPAIGPRLTDHDNAPDSLIGQTLGAYAIKRPIARGGMGTVYLAQQSNPRREVALKVLNASFWSQSAERRFDFEAQILARLQHPNIAQIHEAGRATPLPLGEGRGDGHADLAARRPIPFFAMEYVPNAKRITDYAETHALDIRQRLDLFLQVCDAVQFGHQKGVIHRDLKPANILVSASEPEAPAPGSVKVIDFGVARAIESDVALTTMHTETGQLIGTLAYMSPEQCDADPLGLDVRSDVYSLGVVLYELLCGRLPYDVSKTSIVAAAKTIKEAPPLRPNAIAGSGRRPAGRTWRDIETIILKALAKDRNNRYSSVADFAADIRSHLRGDPIEARPPSRWNRVIRWIARHPIAATVATCVAVAFVSLASTVAGVRWYDGRPRALEFDYARPSEDNQVIRSVRLLAASGRTLGTWPARPDAAVQQVRFAAFFDSAAGWYGNPLVVIGYSLNEATNEFRGKLVALRADTHPPKRAWTGEFCLDDLPANVRDDPRCRPETCHPAVLLTADVFDQFEGPELIVSNALSAFSQRCIRIYDLQGRLHFQVWYDGSIRSMHWLPGSRQIVCTATEEQSTHRLRTETGLDDPACWAVFAFRPQIGFKSSKYLLTIPGDKSLECAWYQYLSVVSSQELPIDVVVETPFNASPETLAQLRIMFNVRPGSTGMTFLVDDKGIETPKSRIADDSYPASRDLHGAKLPPASTIRLQSAPPIPRRAPTPASAPSQVH